MPSRLTQIKWLSIIAFVVGFVGLSEIYGNVEMFFMIMFVFGYSTTDKILDMEREIKSLEEHRQIADEVLGALKKVEKDLKDESARTSETTPHSES